MHALIRARASHGKNGVLRSLLLVSDAAAFASLLDLTQVVDRHNAAKRILHLVSWS